MPSCTLEAGTIGRIRQRAAIRPPPAGRPGDDGDGGWTTVRDIITAAVSEQLAQRSDPAYQLWRLFRGASAPERIPGPDEAVEVACDAFLAGRVLLLIDGRQERQLDAWVRVLPDSRVVFLNLPTLSGA